MGRWQGRHLLLGLLLMVLLLLGGTKLLALHIPNGRIVEHLLVVLVLLGEVHVLG